MIIMGHPWIVSPQFCKVFNQEDIKHTTAKQIVLLEALHLSYALAHYCQNNKIAFAIHVDSLKDALFANALGASYILCEHLDMKSIQSIANEYLFDTRILVHIKDENEIETIARESIDGVIFSEAIC